MKRIYQVLLSLVLGLALSFQAFAACNAVSGLTVNGETVDPSSMIAYLNNPCFPNGLTANGAITPNQGIVPLGTAATAPLTLSNFPMGSVALASIGTNTADVNGQLWITGIWVPANKTISKILILSGGTATTDNILAAIFDYNGKFLQSSALTGATLSGANTFQSLSLLASVQLTGPAMYYVATQGNGTAAGAIETLSALYNSVPTTVVSGVFGTIPSSITVPTTFTAANGPVVELQ